MAPKWNPRNLTRHHRKRLREDPGCFEDLLGIVATGRTMTESQYELRSLDAVAKAWLIFEGEGRDIETREYNENRKYFVDDDLVVAITDSFARDFVTCFHEHFDSASHAAAGIASMSVAQRRMRYEKHLKDAEMGQLIRNVRKD